MNTNFNTGEAISLSATALKAEENLRGLVYG